MTSPYNRGFPARQWCSSWQLCRQRTVRGAHLACILCLCGIGVGCNRSSLLECAALRVQLTQLISTTAVMTTAMCSVGRSLRCQIASLSHQSAYQRQVSLNDACVRDCALHVYPRDWSPTFADAWRVTRPQHRKPHEPLGNSSLVEHTFTR
jgi:hypothetical protein